MKIQWDNLTDFAQRMLNRVGLTSLKEYHILESKYYRSLSVIDKLAEQRVDKFPFVIEPDVLVIDHDRDGSKRIKLLTKNLQYAIDPYMLDSLDDADYKVAFIRHLSMKWARQTEEVLHEIMEKV